MIVFGSAPRGLSQLTMKLRSRGSALWCSRGQTRSACPSRIKATAARAFLFASASLRCSELGPSSSVIGPREFGPERGDNPRRLALYGRKQTHICLVVGGHEQFSQHVGIIAGAVGENRRGKASFAFGSPRIAEDRGQRSEEPLPERAQSLDQRRVISRISDHCRQKLVGDERRYGFPAILGCGGLGVGQRTRCVKSLIGSGPRIVKQGPQSLVNPRMVLLQDAGYHSEVCRRGSQETVVEIVSLLFVIGPQGETG